MPTTALTITLDEGLANRLATAASERGITVDNMIAGCIEQHLEVALRHRVLIERIETVDEQIAAIARFVEEASGGGGLDPVDLFKICRFKCES